MVSSWDEVKIEFLPKRRSPTGKPMIRFLEGAVIHGVYIPAGYTCDGGSIPMAFHWLFNPFGKGLRSFVVHDLRCDTPGYDRRAADAELFRNLKKDRMTIFGRCAIWAAVRLYAIAKQTFGKDTCTDQE